MSGPAFERSGQPTDSVGRRRGSAAEGEPGLLQRLEADAAPVEDLECSQ